MRGFILPQAFRVVANSVNQRQMQVDEVTTKPDGLSIKGTWSLTPEPASRRAPFTLYIPEENWGGLVITSAMPSETVRKLGERIMEILAKIYRCEAIVLKAIALHASASYPQIGLGIGVVSDNNSHEVQLAPFYYPGSSISQNWHYTSIMCAASLLSGDREVDITTVHGGYGETVPAETVSRSSLKVAHEPLLGITFRYQLGDDFFGFAVNPKDWEGLLWLLRRTLREEPYLISLPDPTDNTVVLSSEQNSHTFEWSIVGDSVFTTIYPADQQYFPLTVEFSPTVLQQLRRSAIFRRRYLAEESFPVVLRDTAGNRIENHPCETVSFRQDGGSTIIRFPYAYGGSWPRGSAIARVDGLRLLKIIKSLNGQIYRRQNEAAD